MKILYYGCVFLVGGIAGVIFGTESDSYLTPLLAGLLVGCVGGAVGTVLFD